MTKTAKDAHLWDRSEHEWYREPASCTTGLLTVETFDGLIWDPACGAGSVIDGCERSGVQCVGTDIVARKGQHPAWFRGRHDFLTLRSPFVRNIITNPPFGKGLLTEAFIRHALALDIDKLAVFTDIKFLTSAKRARGLYAAMPPDRVWMLTPRPSCPPGAYLEAGNKAGGGTADFCWLVWDLKTPYVSTTLGWLKHA